jgi:chemotaxis protein histidine kinase CheA
MIYCPQCGTPNKPNSKFCKNCAAPLQPSTDIRCPICGMLNPQTAASCKSCGTRLLTSAAGISAADQSSPADAPENITPFNPPELFQDADAPVEKPSAASSPRPTFGRSNTQWLRRMGKTPSEAKPSAPPAPATPPTESTPPPEAPKADSPLPLEPLQASSDAQDTTASDAPTAVKPAPAKPQLSEIKLTGDDYDYSDIGGQVTDEMKAQLEAQASQIQSVEDEVELARRLLGLSTVEAEPPQVPAPVEPTAAASVEPVAQEGEIPTATVEPAAQVAEESVAEAASQAMPPAHEEPESPEWIASLAAASSAAVAAEMVTPEETEAPEAITPETTAPPQAEIATAVPETSAAPIQETPPEVPALENGNIPDWLRDMAPPEVLEADAAASADQETHEQGKATPTVVGASALLSHLPDLDEAERAELPDWLREPIAPEEAAPAAETAEPSHVSETPLTSTPVELPAWMRGEGTAVREPMEVVETTGPLAGISGILPLAVALSEPHTLITPAPARSDGGRIFQTLLAEPLAAAAPPQAAAPTAHFFTGKHLLYLLILLAALVALFLPAGADELGLLGKDVVNSPSAVFHDQLTALPANSTVLMAFDYAPGQTPELDPAARAILENLTTRPVNVIALSTNPNGAAIAEGLLERAQQAHPQFTFVNLGYIPGNEAGLKRLALGWLPAAYVTANGARWDRSPLAKNIRGMDDLALNILIVGDNNALNLWMTQVQPIVKSPMVAATTAEIDPQARIYVNAKQLSASLRGLTGAAELELWSGSSGQAVKTVNALSFVSLMLAGIIIAANVVWLVRRNKK